MSAILSSIHPLGYFSNLPFKYRLDYIESTENTYINTNYLPNGNTTIEATYAITSTTNNRNYVFATLTDTHSRLQFSPYVDQTTKKNTIFYGYSNQFTSDACEYPIITNEVKKVVVDKGVLKIDDEVICDYSYLSGDNFTPSSYPLLLFTAYNSSHNPTTPQEGIKLFDLKIYENDELLHHYIPVLDYKSTACLYDVITNKCLYNSLNGSFEHNNPFLCEVEYIEQTAKNQWIETGLYPSYSTDFDLIVSGAIANNITDRHILLGTHTTSSNSVADLNIETQRNSGTYNLRYYTPIDGEASDYKVGKYTINTPFKMHTNWNSDTRTIVFTSDDTTTQTKTFSTGITLSGTLNPVWFFNDQRAEGKVGTAGTRIYKVYYKSNTKVSLDIIPVLDTDEKPALYNRADGKLLYNTGTDTTEFAYGRRIYPVEYLESSGTQYIDTNFIPTAETSFDIQFIINNVTTDYTTILYSGDLYGSPDTFGSCVSKLRLNKVYAYYGSTYNKMTTEYFMVYGDLYNVTLDKTQMVVKNLTKNKSETVELGGSFTKGTRSLYIFNGNTETEDLQHPLQGKFYYCKLKDNDIVVRNFIPAVDENDVGFMLDKINHVIYDNKGTDAFITGGKLK